MIWFVGSKTSQMLASRHLDVAIKKIRLKFWVGIFSTWSVSSHKICFHAYFKLLACLSTARKEWRGRDEHPCSMGSLSQAPEGWLQLASCLIPCCGHQQPIRRSGWKLIQWKYWFSVRSESWIAAVQAEEGCKILVFEGRKRERLEVLF